MQNSIHPPESKNGQMTALRWVSIVLSALVVITALVIGEGFFGGRAQFIEDHGYLGNVIFIFAVAQIALAFLQYQKGVVSRNQLILSGLLILLIFAQIGLGYSGSRSGAANALVWHLPVGVLIMGVSTVLAVLFWTQPQRTAISD